MFDEIPKVDFSVKDADGNIVFRDAIVYNSMAELRNDSQAEREAKFQARYDAWVEAQANPTIGQETLEVE